MAANRPTKAAPAVGKVTVDVTFTYARDTKNKYRYDAPEGSTVVGTLYVDKAAYPKGAPQTIKVTVEL